MQSSAKDECFWGIAFRSPNARDLLSMTYAHRKRLPIVCGYLTFGDISAT
jgi:hypothetical protein